MNIMVYFALKTPFYDICTIITLSLAVPIPDTLNLSFLNQSEALT